MQLRSRLQHCHWFNSTGVYGAHACDRRLLHTANSSPAAALDSPLGPPLIQFVRPHVPVSAAMKHTGQVARALSLRP